MVTSLFVHDCKVLPDATDLVRNSNKISSVHQLKKLLVFDFASLEVPTVTTVKLVEESVVERCIQLVTNCSELLESLSKKREEGLVELDGSEDDACEDIDNTTVNEAEYFLPTFPGDALF